MKIDLTVKELVLVQQALERFVRTVAGDVARAKRGDDRLNDRLKAVMDLEKRFKGLKGGES